MLSGLEWAWPWVGLIWPLPLLLRWLSRHRLSPHALSIPGGPAVEPFDSRPTPPGMPWLGLVAWTLLLLAAMRPEEAGEPMQLPAEGRDLMLAVDISGSMSEQDVRWEGRRVDRLQVVQAAAGEFLRGRQGDRVGLVLFGESAHLYTPLSLDTATAADMLREVEVGLAGQKTAIGDALAVALEHLLDASQNPEKVIVLLTDGENNAGDVPPEKAASLAAQAGVRIHTIGLASEVRAGGMLGAFMRGGIDNAQLQKLAQLGQGRSFIAEGGQALRAVYAELDRIEARAVAEEIRLPPQPLYWWPLLGAALFCLLQWAMGWRQH